ncbi:MAG: hypothetical protein PHW46_02055 [Candidatus Omnitrophica bacterium]|nr:hypothetical protein [Candidatus Omnitrophota bacterium]
MDHKKTIQECKGISRYSTAIVIYGLYILVGAGNYRQFLIMFKGLDPFLVYVIYFFTVLYGISCLYCGVKIRKLEDWARKLMIIMTAISVASGLFLNRIAISNMRIYLLSGREAIPANVVETVFISSVIITAFTALFELSIIFFFTRPGVVREFSSESRD